MRILHVHFKICSCAFNTCVHVYITAKHCKLQLQRAYMLKSISAAVYTRAQPKRVNLHLEKRMLHVHTTLSVRKYVYGGKE